MLMLITSGGTKVPIDKVRDITNMSNGTFGRRIAIAALEEAHSVHFFHAKHSKTPFKLTLDYFKDDWRTQLDAWGDFYQFCEQNSSNYDQSAFRNYDDYAEGLEQLILNTAPQVVVLAAAVSDYGVAHPVDGKIRSADQQTIEMEPLPKLISQIKKWHPRCFLVGFKLLVNSTEDELLVAAEKSFRDNGCDMIVANDLRDIKNDDHRLLLLARHGEMVVRRKSESQNPNFLATEVVNWIERWYPKFSSALPEVSQPS